LGHSWSAWRPLASLPPNRPALGSAAGAALGPAAPGTVPLPAPPPRRSAARGARRGPPRPLARSSPRGFGAPRRPRPPARTRAGPRWERGDPRGPRPPSRRAAGRAGRGAGARARPARSPVRVLRVRGSDRGGGGDGCRRWLARSLLPCWASAAPADVCLPISGLGRKGGGKKKFHLNLNKKTFNMKSHSGNGHGP
ncbi:translation initiation factor IF-2-like, partial [Oenanthe melanoleuca]|uniref:translation initiation factor IF-2-like n=1 Tax=Oenanthe melanoleuca TaxID=2939378 RepID=UPI0024C1C40A